MYTAIAFARNSLVEACVTRSVLSIPVLSLIDDCHRDAAHTDQIILFVCYPDFPHMSTLANVNRAGYPGHESGFGTLDMVCVYLQAHAILGLIVDGAVRGNASKRFSKRNRCAAMKQPIGLMR